MELKHNVEILQVSDGAISQMKDTVISEHTLSIYLNGVLFVQLLCLPQRLVELAIGNLFSEGVIRSCNDIDKIEACGTTQVHVTLKTELSPALDIENVPRTVMTGCGKPHSIAYHVIKERNTVPFPIDFTVHWSEIIQGMKAFQSAGVLFQETGATHACALSTGRETLFFCEDIGRHNALDKIFGMALQAGVALGDKLLFTTGRVPGDMIIKAVHAKIPVVVSRSAPTDQAIQLAKQYRITLCGFARQNRMNIYSCPERISGIR